jgi:hypothetical protein
LSYESDEAFISRAFLNAASTAWLAAKKTPQKTLRRKKGNQISFYVLERKPCPTKKFTPIQRTKKSGYSFNRSKKHR